MKKIAVCLSSVFLLILAGCTFDYGEIEPAERDLPDLIMENVQYVRVRAADPIAKFEAERAERYEKQGLMKLERFYFEQYSDHGSTVNATGNGGSASAKINSGDVFMDNGVWLEVESEDIILETFQLDWKDETRILSSGEEIEVTISQQNGTCFTGIGLLANTRDRTWEFTGDSSGSYVFEEDEDAEENTGVSVEEAE